MKFTMTKIAAGLVLAVAATGAQAVTTSYVTNLSIIEIGGIAGLTLGSATASVNQGGVFYFGAESGNGLRPTGMPVFNSTGAGAVGINPGATGNLGAGQAVNTISTGFTYSGFAFDMDTVGTNANPAGGVSAVIDSVNGLVLNLDSWGGYWVGTGGHHHMLNPDAGSLVTSYQVLGGVTYYTADWSHVITLAEDANGGVDEFGDPTYNGFTGQRADWHLEGIATVAAVPEASTYGMMLAGLGLVGFAVRRRKMVA